MLSGIYTDPQIHEIHVQFLVSAQKVGAILTSHGFEGECGRALGWWHYPSDSVTLSKFEGNLESTGKIDYRARDNYMEDIYTPIYTIYIPVNHL